MPAVLLECGVIVNREEEKSLASPATQAKIVEAILHALGSYFDQATEPAASSETKTAN